MASVALADNTYLCSDSRTTHVLRFPPRSTILTSVLVVILAVGFIAGSAAAVPLVVASPDAAGTTTVTGGNLTGANTTTPHENPDTVAEDGDPEQLASHLSGRLGTLLQGSTRNISAAEYDQARSLVGDEYDEVLSQYVTVAGETGQEDTAEGLAATQNDTAELIALQEEFDATHAAYEQAVADGDTERARRLARELARLAAEIDGVAVQLDQNLTSIENTTGSDLEAVRRDVETVQLTTAETASTATQAELTPTTVTATTAPSAFSFQNATQVTGTLRTANGTPLSNDSVTIDVGQRSYQVTTDAAGNYTLSYRPVFLSANATRVPVVYRPANASPYQGANTTARASVTSQTPTTITVTNTSLSGNTTAPLQVASTVTVGPNMTVAGVPVVLLLNGQQISTGTTRSDGHVRLTGTVPAAVAAGPTTLQVQVPLTNTAVAGTTTTQSAEITPVDTQLTLNATLTEADTTTTSQEAVLTGQLTLPDGSPVATQPLTVFVGDQQVGTVTTAADGRYQTTVAASTLDEYAETAPIRVTFAGRQTHLAASDATTSLTLPATSQPSSGSGVSLRLLAGVGGVLLLFGLGVGLIAWRTGWLPLTADASTATAATDATQSASNASEAPPTQQPHSQQLLNDAFTALAAEDTTTAIQLAYGSLRAALRADVEAPDPATHWEFYQRCQDAEIDSLPALEAVISAYELATFAQPAVSLERARDVLEQVAAVIDHDPDSTPNSRPADDDA